jgi:hypothetical protein
MGSGKEAQPDILSMDFDAITARIEEAMERSRPIDTLFDCINAIGWGYFDSDVVNLDNFQAASEYAFEVLFKEEYRKRKVPAELVQTIQPHWASALTAAAANDAKLCLGSLRLIDQALLSNGVDLFEDGEPSDFLFAESQPEWDTEVHFHDGHVLKLLRGGSYRIRQGRLNEGRSCVVVKFDHYAASSALVRFDDNRRTSKVDLADLENLE